ncbi:MAG: hypothetical protein IJ250_06075, partial [Bacteroidales bacterium]|nr:hypothetical protein [Bacteroidales bacterium]
MLETLTRPLHVIPVVYPVKRKKRFLYSTVYHLTPSAAHLISLITGVKKRYMYNLCVHNNLIPLPKGFDAITWGRKSEKAHISLKKTFFHDDDITMQDITMWINILCHEVSHVPQINKYRFLCFGLLPYLFAHIY